MPFSQDDTNRIKAALRSALESPSLNQWQRTFLTDMQARFDQYGPRTRLSDKQYAKLKEILAPFQAKEPSGSKPPPPKPRPAKIPRPRQTPAKPRPVPRSRSRPQSPLKTIRKARRATRDMIWVLFAIGGLIAAVGGMFESSGPSSEDRTATVRNLDRLVYSSATDFSITDGDTVHLYGARKGTRLVGFNTPETYKPQCNRELALGQQATARLKNLVRSASQVELRLVACACPPGTQGTNNCNYGRSCGILRVDGRDVGDVLIREGLAVGFNCGRTSCPPLPRPWCR